VQTPPVAQALAAGVYDSAVLPMFDTFTQTGVAWSNTSDRSGSNSQLQQLDVDAVIWATGYNNATQHLLPLGVLGEFRIKYIYSCCDFVVYSIDCTQYNLMVRVRISGRTGSISGLRSIALLFVYTCLSNLAIQLRQSNCYAHTVLCSGQTTDASLMLYTCMLLRHVNSAREHKSRAAARQYTVYSSYWCVLCRLW
jgi:hypothetical protein